jgi:putative endonuclease
MRSFFGRFSLANRVGRDGEKVAEHFLRRKGYSIVGRNITNPRGRRLGEIDIVALEKDIIVFFEVKTRTSAFLPPGMLIRREKLRRLAKIGEWYMKQTGWIGRKYRFDMLSVKEISGKEPEITHIQNIFL